jgi:hypothetical protein
VNQIETSGYDGNNRRRSVVDRLGKAPLVVVSLFVILAAIVFAIASTNANAARFAKLSAERQADTKAQSEFNARLLKIVQEFNEAHAEATGESFQAMADALQCATTKFVQQASLEDIQACYRPIAPQPLPLPQPELEKPKK